MKKQIYKVVVNGTVVYTGALIIARNRYNHAVIEDWKYENIIQLIRNDGYIIEDNQQ